MIIYALVASLGLWVAVDATPPAFDCGTRIAHASPNFLKTIQDLHGETKRGFPAGHGSLIIRDHNTPITVDAVFHMVATSAQKDSITNEMPSAQLDSLNESYKPYGISFNLINVTWTTNDKWAMGATTDDDDEMKQTLRQGTYNTLNLYFQTNLSGGVLGRCTLPSQLSTAAASSNATIYSSDGCNINAHTMPSGALTGYNQGKTAVHETGHWLGLLHTFEGYTCTGPGDYIDDTPVESAPTDGCPTHPVKKTCPLEQRPDEADPVHNFMDYSLDACYEGFTELQGERMRRMWELYRKGK